VSQPAVCGSVRLVPRPSPGDTGRAMSQENVRILREMYGRRTLAEASELMHPAAEMRQPSALPDTDEYHGRDELVRGTRLALEAYEGFRFTAEEVVDLGERAFMRVRLSARGKTSGIELAQTVFHLWTFRDGMPWRCEVFVDEDAAQQAVGLRE
jgi:ketosteroid isomerase-like protein